MLRIVILAISGFILFQVVAPDPVRANEGPWCAIRNFGSDLIGRLPVPHL